MKDYKHLAETIYRRNSFREFSKKPVDFLEGGIDLIESFEIQVLIDTVKVKVKVLGKDKIKNERSDYCIAFYSEKKPLYLENIGFIGQQIDLELQSKGLGTCWWGMKKPKRKYRKLDGLECVITMTAGWPQTSGTRVYPDGFDRKAAAGIIIGDTIPDGLTEAVRVAPSAVNLQPWLIEKTDNRYNFFIRPPKTIMERIIGDMRHIDMGIDMAHMFVRAKANGLNVSIGFEGKDTNQGKYIGTIIV